MLHLHPALLPLLLPDRVRLVYAAEAGGAQLAGGVELQPGAGRLQPAVPGTHTEMGAAALVGLS